MAEHSPTPEAADRPSNAKPLTREVPGSIRALVILNVVFGSIGVGYGLLYVFQSVQALRTEGAVVTTASDRVEAEVDWTVVAENTVSLVLAVGLLVSAFGLRKLRQWGRRLALAAAAGLFVHGIIRFGFYIYQVSQPTQVNNRPDTLVRIVAIGVGCTEIVPIVYAILLCVILFRRKTAALFAPDASSTPIAQA